MPDVRACLLVGGPKDGDWVAVSTTQELIVVYTMPLIRIQSVSERALVGETLRPEYHQYVRMKLKGAARTFDIFAHEGLDSDDVLEMLLRGYNPSVLARGGNG